MTKPLPPHGAPQRIHPGRRGGRLRVGFGYYTYELVPRLIVELRALSPEIEFSLRDMSTVDQIRDLQNGELDIADIDEETFENNLYTSGMPNPELLIRTSGEYRISNYLLWQIAYAELYFTPKLWPDFRREDLFEAIIDYQKRERRFGMISEQLN